LNIFSSFSIWNSLAGKDLVEGRIGQVYTMKEDCPKGYAFGCDIAKLEVKIK
jgi:hypothetical protein